MDNARSFMKLKRKGITYRPVCERIKDFSSIYTLRTEKDSQDQASRCMDCGTPFCHWGCPLGNYISEWNTLFASGRTDKAIELLDATNNLPEITGRICPAPCEYACVLGTSDDPVTIRENELAITEYAFMMGYRRLRPPQKRTGKKVALIGSGPAGLSCAMQLNRAGHDVTIFERDEKPGGILRYGIPDFKLEKSLLDQRISMMEGEGVLFVTSADVGVNYKVSKILKSFDAVALACGARMPRDLKIEGRELKGIHFAMEYLVQSNRRVAGEKIAEKDFIDAKGKRVVVIGGGDTGADCVGTAHRQGASCVVQIELLPKPPECRTVDYPWPSYPLLLKTSTSHEEGGQRLWQVVTKRFLGNNSKVEKISCAKVEFIKGDTAPCPVPKEIPASEFDIEADLVLLAIGFTGTKRDGLIEKFGVELDECANVKSDSSFMTSKKGIFACGDTRRGQSLVVWAIAEGRRAAHNIDKYLMGSSDLPAL